MVRLYLIEILHQTTTRRCFRSRENWLYLIEILHQTTTRTDMSLSPTRLYLIEILHQTTTTLYAMLFHASCILLKFYIKPQL